MIIVSIVFRNRRNPDCIESHILNIVKLLSDSFEVTSAVFA
jgi:hypothetical protein